MFCDRSVHADPYRVWFPGEKGDTNRSLLSDQPRLRYVDYLAHTASIKWTANSETTTHSRTEPLRQKPPFDPTRCLRELPIELRRFRDANSQLGLALRRVPSVPQSTGSDRNSCFLRRPRKRVQKTCSSAWKACSGLRRNVRQGCETASLQNVERGVRPRGADLLNASQVPD